MWNEDQSLGYSSGHIHDSDFHSLDLAVHDNDQQQLHGAHQQQQQQNANHHVNDAGSGGSHSQQHLRHDHQHSEFDHFDEAAHHHQHMSHTDFFLNSHQHSIHDLSDKVFESDLVYHSESMNLHLEGQTSDQDRHQHGQGGQDRHHLQGQQRNSSANIRGDNRRQSGPMSGTFASPLLDTGLDDDFTPLLSPAIASGTHTDNFQMPPAVLDLMPEPAMTYDFENQQSSSSQSSLHQQHMQSSTNQWKPQVKTSRNRVSKPSPSIKPQKYNMDSGPPSASASPPEGPPGSGSLRARNFSNNMGTFTSTSSMNNESVVQSKPASSSSAGPVTPSMLMNLQSKDTANVNMATEDRLRTALQATVSSASRQPLRKKSAIRSNTSSPVVSSIAPKHPLISPSIRPKPNHRNSMSKVPSASPGLSPMMIPRTQSLSMKQAPAEIASHDTINEDLSNVLASKSNYQHIMEGTHNKIGLSYPETLSAELSSKKTNHKLAEQERRNRINQALQELSGLISKPNPELASERPKQAPSSKADIVETAIVYIQNMHKQMEQLRQENLHLKAQQQQQQQQQQSSSPSSHDGALSS